jgi:hypothetical protein
MLHISHRTSPLPVFDAGKRSCDSAAAPRTARTGNRAHLFLCTFPQAFRLEANVNLSD